MGKVKVWFKKESFRLLIIGIAILLSYINIFQNQFQFDDPGFITSWQETHTWTHIPDFFKGLVPSGHGGIYRPIRSVLYTVSYHIWGGEHTFGYHLQSILTILFASFLIYKVTKQITKNNMVAFTTSLLFGLHPVHTEAITFMTASFDSIASSIFLLSFYLYLKAFDSKRHKLKFLLLSSILAIIAFFSYEMTLTLPLIIFLYDLIFRTSQLKKIKTYLKYLFYLLPALIFIFIRVFILHIIKRGDYLAGSIYVTFLTMLRAFLKYLEVLVYPVHLNVNHNLGPGIHAFMWAESKKEVLIKQTILDPPILSGLLILLSLIAIAVLCFKKHKVITFAIGWFFITLSPLSDIIPQATIMAEKYLFLPSFGFCLITGYLLNKLYVVRTRRRLAIMILALVGLGFSYLTILRNGDWKNGTTLWTSAAKDAPESIYNRNNLGSNYANNRNYDLAIVQFKKIIELNPKNDNAFRQLALAYQDQNKLDLAIEQIKKIIELKPKATGGYELLGSIYQKMGKFDLAEAQYKKVLELTDNKDATAFYNLGSLYDKKENIYLAIEYYQEALNKDPNSAESHNNLGIIYLNQGKLDLAIEQLKKAVSINPKLTSAYYNLGKAYEEKVEIKQALENYFKAEDLNENFVEVHLNLGVIYAKAQRFDLAIEKFKKVISLKPDGSDGHFNLGMAYRAVGEKDLAIEELKIGLDLKLERQMQIILDELLNTK